LLVRLPVWELRESFREGDPITNEEGNVYEKTPSMGLDKNSGRRE